MTIDIVDKIHNQLDRMEQGKDRDKTRVFIDAYLALLIGEVELGDPTNTYLYLQLVQSLATKVMRRFIDQARSNGNIATVCPDEEYVVIVNRTQRFYFTSYQRANTLMAKHKFDRVFADIAFELLPVVLRSTLKLSLASNYDNDGDVI